MTRIPFSPYRDQFRGGGEPPHDANPGGYSFGGAEPRNVPRPRTAAEVLYGDSDNPARPESPDPYVSYSDRRHLGKVRDDYESARASGDAEVFRQALYDIGGTLQSYPHLRPHLPTDSIRAYGDFRRALDKAEQDNFTARGLRSTADDRAWMAQKAAIAVLRGMAQRPSATPAVERGTTGASGGRGENAKSETSGVKLAEWLYEQKTGDLYRVDESEVVTHEGRGYAGKGAGLNNPDMDHVPDVGPPPRGGYATGKQQDITTRRGRKMKGAIPLIPDPGNEMYGRSGFLVHGDTNAHNNTASEGCIILPPGVRNRMGASQDRRVKVY